MFECTIVKSVRFHSENFRSCSVMLRNIAATFALIAFCVVCELLRNAGRAFALEQFENTEARADRINTCDATCVPEMIPTAHSRTPAASSEHCVDARPLRCV